MAPAGQVPGEWAQAYHYGGGSASLGLRGAGADGSTVRAAVRNGAGDEWGEAYSTHISNGRLG